MRRSLAALALLMLPFAAWGCESAAVDATLPLRDRIASAAVHFAPALNRRGDRVAWLRLADGKVDLLEWRVGDACGRRLFAASDGASLSAVAWSDQDELYVHGTVGGIGPLFRYVGGASPLAEAPGAPWKLHGEYATSQNNYGYCALTYRDTGTGQLGAWDADTAAVVRLAGGVGLIPLPDRAGALSGITVERQPGSTRWIGLRGTQRLPLVEFDADDTRRGGQFVSVNRTNDQLYFLSSTTTDRIALMSIDLRSLQRRTILEAPSDITDVSINPLTHEPDIAFHDPDVPRAVAIDAPEQADLARIAAQLEAGEWPLIRSRSSDDGHWLVEVAAPGGPPAWRIYQRKDRTLGPAFHPAGTPPSKAMRTDVHRIAARDGTEIVAYVTTDADACPDSCPTVFEIHGGPTRRSYYAYTARRAWLASRGYRVVELNYRGSSGRGKTFERLEIGHWGTTMQDDIDDVFDALLARAAIAKPAAVLGSSYGAFAALNALARGDRFALAAVDSPTTDLPAFVDYHRNANGGTTDLLTRVGDPRDRRMRAELTRRSPLGAIARLSKKPLLLIQGGADTITPASANQVFYRQIDRRNRAASVVTFPRLSHGLPEGRFYVDALIEGFLHEHLGGRFEPLTAVERSRLADATYMGKRPEFLSEDGAAERVSAGQR